MNAKATSQDDVAAIKGVGEEFFAGVNAGDLDRRMTTMDPDVIIMPPDRPSIVGRDAIRRLSQDYAVNFDEQVSLAFEEVEVAGDWAFARARVNGERTRRSDGAVEQIDLQNLWIFKRQVDGKWKFWRIIFNHANATQAGSAARTSI